MSGVWDNCNLKHQWKQWSEKKLLSKMMKRLQWPVVTLSL